jgi:hypothetical protein
MERICVEGPMSPQLVAAGTGVSRVALNLLFEQGQGLLQVPLEDRQRRCGGLDRRRSRAPLWSVWILAAA